MDYPNPLIELLATALPPPEWWETVSGDLVPPFPYFGSKRKIVDMVWDRLGNPVNVVEPFAGSLAVLLARPHAPTIETVNDLDGHLINLWRSIQQAPDIVAHYADQPVHEIELHARHKYLTALRGRLAARLLDDPFYCNPMIAGWWIWGLCAWIGSGWCSGSQPKKRPELGAGESGRPRNGKGVHTKGMHSGQLPDLGARAEGQTGGRGVHRASMRLPHLGAGTGGEDDHPCAHYGQGVHAAGMRAGGQLPKVSGGSGNGPMAKAGDGVHSGATRSRLPEVFAALSNRLRYVRVTCGDFERILSPAVTWRHGLTGVFLDPPYPPDAGLAGGLYASTRTEREVFDRCFRWAITNGARNDLRIAFCYYDGVTVRPVAENGEPAHGPAEDVTRALKRHGWDVVAWKAHGGYSGQSEGENVNAARERVAFSPACLRARQGSLF